jgi:hypothetical protein
MSVEDANACVLENRGIVEEFAHPVSNLRPLELVSRTDLHERSTSDR